VRIGCPICGERDRREFYYKGAALALQRPDPGAGLEVWDAYLHLRDNPAGITQELWYHESGCSAWLVVARDTTSHEIVGVEMATTVSGAGA